MYTCNCISHSYLVLFTTSYEKDVYSKNQDISGLLADNISNFMDGAYSLNEALAENPSILTMQTEIQTPLLERCVENNSYLDLLYIQGTDGMQTGRSSGELADRSTRWWFKQMMEEKKAFISKSYYSVATGKPCASIFYPMYQENELTGVYAADLKLDFLQDLIGEYSSEEEGRISFVIDSEGVVVAHPDTAQIEEQYNYRDLIRTVSVKDSSGNPEVDGDGNIITEEHPLEISDSFKKVIAQVMAGQSGSTRAVYDGETCYVSYTDIALKGESGSWSLITLHKKKSAMSTVYRMLFVAVIVSLIVISAAIFVVVFLARRLTMPVASMTGLLKEASEGDFSLQADESCQNEVGLLANSFNVMAGKISNILVRIKEFTKELLRCSGKLQVIEGNMGDISNALEEISEGTVAQTADVNDVVERMAQMEEKFGELKSKSGNLLNEADHTIDSGKEGGISIRELQQQNRYVEKNVNMSYEKIKALEEHSLRIADIVDTINDISSETGLLSLNASIEAAKAGEYGRGFVVVAESIGKLADDSVNATANIEKIIGELYRDIGETVSNIEDVKKAMAVQLQAAKKVEEVFHIFTELAGQTSSSVNDIDQLIEEMYDIDHSIVQAAQRIRDVSGKTEDLSMKVSSSLGEELQDIQSSVCSLTSISGDLETEMSKFKLNE